jgi:hypothetical protein
MDMKGHILAALQEQLERWTEFLASLDGGQTGASAAQSEWSLKDEVAHLWAWQERSRARFQAAIVGREPHMPGWVPGVDPEDLEATDVVNGWIYETNRERPWAEVSRDWREGYARLIGMAERIPERDLLDSEKYSWLGGYPLVMVLLGTYDHHQEHLDKLIARLGRA